MKVNDTLKKKKWLKARKRVKRLNKTHNYIEKTKKGVHQLYIDQSRMQDAADEAERKKTRSNIAKSMGLNPREVI